MSVTQVTVPFLTDAQRETLSSALSDAAEYRYPSSCEECLEAPAGLCEPHAADLLLAESYYALADEFGLTLEG